MTDEELRAYTDLHEEAGRNVSYSRFVDYCPDDTPIDDVVKAFYEPRYATEVAKLRLLGATREDVRRWLGVHESFLDIWTETYEGFARALEVEPVPVDVVEDFGYINWLKDLRRGTI